MNKWSAFSREKKAIQFNLCTHRQRFHLRISIENVRLTGAFTDANSSCANLMTIIRCLSKLCYTSMKHFILAFFESYFCGSLFGLSFVHLIAGNSFCREIVAFWAPNTMIIEFDQCDLDAEHMESHVKRKQPTINITNRQRFLVLVRGLFCSANWYTTSHIDTFPLQKHFDEYYLHCNIRFHHFLICTTINQ